MGVRRSSRRWSRVSSFFFLGWLQTFQRSAGDGAVVRLERSVPPEFRNLTDGVVVPLWSVDADRHALRGALPLHAAVRRGEAAEDVRAADDGAGAAGGDRPRQVPGRAGHHHRHAGADHRLPARPLAVRRRSESGTRAGVAHGAAGLRGLLLWGATCMAVGHVHLRAHRDPRWWRRSSPSRCCCPGCCWRRWRSRSEEPLRSVASTCPVRRSCRTCYEGVLDLKALVFFASVICFSLLLTHRAVEAQRWAYRGRTMRHHRKDPGRARAAAAALQRRTPISSSPDRAGPPRPRRCVGAVPDRGLLRHQLASSWASSPRGGPPSSSSPAR